MHSNSVGNTSFLDSIQKNYNGLQNQARSIYFKISTLNKALHAGNILIHLLTLNFS